MATSAKAIKLAAELADELRKRVSDYAAITEGFDSNGWPTISLTADATPATTEDNVFIRVRPRDWALATDVLGSAQTVYTPSVIQVATEASATATGIMDYTSIAHALSILTTCSKRGTRLELWEETNGTVPSATTFNTAAKLKASIEPELDWPLLASQ